MVTLMECVVCQKTLKQVYSAPESDQPHCVKCGELAWQEWEKGGK